MIKEPAILGMRNTLFDTVVLTDAIRDSKAGIKQIHVDEEALYIWFSMVLTRDNRLESELKGYAPFQDIILRRVLGYTHKTVRSHSGVKRTVEFALGEPNLPPYCVIELKGLGADLFKPQVGRKRAESPMDQARNYARNQKAPYCLVSDYNRFVFFPFAAPDNEYIDLAITDLFLKKNGTSFSVTDLEKQPTEVARVDYLRQRFDLDWDGVFAFHALLHQSTLLDQHLVDDFRKATSRRRESISDEFYALFHRTRMQLIWEIRSQNPHLDFKKVVHVAQLTLNRWLFVCFAERHPAKLLPRDTSSEAILEPILNDQLTRYSTDILIRKLILLWTRLDRGEPRKGIFAYNGGLFAEPLSEIKIRDWISKQELKEVAKYSGQPEILSIGTTSGSKKKTSVFGGNKDIEKQFLSLRAAQMIIHPLYLNLVRIAQYDFEADISVEILGHVFEQSVSDLEAILKSSGKVSRRKKQGIYYTPSFITDYITRHAINSYLLNAISAPTTDTQARTQDIINVYLEQSSIDILEENLKDIRILDPACGSGAFLCRAVDVLLEFHQKVRETRESTVIAKAQTRPQKQRKRKKQDESTVQTELEGYLSQLTNTVLLENIFGVDLSEESVQITRLSLYLKIIDLVKHRLPILDANVRVGNSLVSDPNADPLAFDWQSAFPTRDFDVVVGNPPYVRIQNLDVRTKKALESAYSKAIGAGNYDLYLAFIYKGWELLSDDGVLGYIIPNKFFILEYGETLRNHLSQQKAVSTVIDFTWEQVFPGPTTYSTLMFLSRTVLSGSQSKGHRILYQRVIDLELWRTNPFDYHINQTALVQLPKSGPWYLFFDDERDFVARMSKKGSRLGSIANIFQGVTTGADAVYVLEHISSSSQTEHLQSKQISKMVEEGIIARSSEVDLEEQMLKPLLKGSDLYRFKSLKAMYRLLFPYLVNKPVGGAVPSVTKLTEDKMKLSFPMTLEYLNICQEKLSGRGGADKLPHNQWFLYTYEKSIAKYGLPKLIWQVLSSRCNFAFDENGEFAFVGGATAGGQGLILPPEGGHASSTEDYLELLAILNSTPVDLFIKLHSSKFRGGFFAYGKGFTKNVPILRGTSRKSSLVSHSRNLIDLTRRIVSKTQAFEDWLELKVTIPQSFNALKHIDKPEKDFRALIYGYKKRITPKALANIVAEFMAFKSEVLRLQGKVAQTEAEVDEEVLEIYGLTGPAKGVGGRSIKDFIRDHPFMIHSG